MKLKSLNLVITGVFLCANLIRKAWSSLSETETFVSIQLIWLRVTSYLDGFHFNVTIDETKMRMTMVARFTSDDRLLDRRRLYKRTHGRRMILCGTEHQRTRWGSNLSRVAFGQKNNIPIVWHHQNLESTTPSNPVLMIFWCPFVSIMIHAKYSPRTPVNANRGCDPRMASVSVFFV